MCVCGVVYGAEVCEEGGEGRDVEPCFVKRYVRKMERWRVYYAVILLCVANQLECLLYIHTRFRCSRLVITLRRWARSKELLLGQSRKSAVKGFGEYIHAA
jgi:hypothetical protein